LFSVVVLRHWHFTR